MLVLGDKYKFIPLELERLKNEYGLEPKYITDLSIENISSELQASPDIVILNTNQKLPKETVSFLTSLELNGIQFITIEHFLEKYLKKIYIPRKVENLDFLDHIRPFTPKQNLIKRIIDFSIAIPLGIVALPIMIYSAYRIKKESPNGPIIFKQTRIGKNAKLFVCYKFRSMHTNTNFFSHYTQDNDPRIFPWGAIMRKTRIDELPQLWNVIKGELHIIGPRAEWDELVKKYEKEWSFYHLRHLNAPGITGWAQVNYPYGKNLEDTYQKLMYDLYYIKNWSLGLEIKTILKTVGTILSKKGT